jgi:hypothetical protein
MPKFQAIPNFDSLAPTTTKGDIITRTSTANVRRAVGSDGQVLTADSTQTDGVKWSAVAAGAMNVVSKTTTYSAVINDYILASSSSFAITLPTAVGVSGQQIGIQHNGTSLSQVYTLNTTSSQTIGGIASGSYALYTNGEVLILVSDGANWQVLSHRTETPWTAFSSLAAGTLWTATTTSPAYGTIAVHLANWRRSGTEMLIQYVYTTTSAGTAGSGLYLFNLPSSATVNTSVTPAPTTAPSTSSIGGGASAVGSGKFAATTVTNTARASYLTVFVYSTTQLYFVGTADVVATEHTWESGGFGTGFANNPVQFTFTARLPISGWQP